ncbi:MAG: outer membrane beta-barrel protein [Alphaproteobacteria bacterium]|nr:outer membrane beta-barrel protein [Alphaproteobacteria bacterium]MBU6472705.1 outer membrane beta-barrel protein [Alphaproteobacteria bacterium]MDE2012199.1 outer membrane beta-barrel protein [Alphaproteobacteria bacterium]MDE2074586.1 outer membrane beta-barrel protein [Alphaproteobacteria bacterium]MDE2350421.1 outer membrane beta-barrel protein [Alphaproteobacteria bacterium]
MCRYMRFAVLGALCLASTSLVTPAAAQYAAAGVGAAAAPTAPAAEGDYAPKGLPLGGFRLFPSLQLGANYDDNIYRTDTNAKDSFYFLEQPAFILQSQWGLHKLDLFGSLGSYQYASYSHENHTDWSAGGDGRLDILRGIDLTGGGSYATLHEARTSPDQPFAASTPTQYRLSKANAAFEYHPYHFGFTVGGTYMHYDYSATSLIGLPPVDNTDRNRDEYTGYVKASYEFSPGYAMFVQANERDVQYAAALDRNGLHRDNHGYSVNGGLEMALTDLITGQIYGGYLNEHYTAPLKTVSGFNFGADVDWTPTPLWTFHLTASRLLNGTTIDNASAEDDQSVRLAADYKFRRDVTIQAFGGYTDSNFNGSPRHDKYTSAGVNLNYYLTRSVSAQLGYAYQTRSSSLAGQGFSDNLITLGLNLHL